MIGRMVLVGTRLAAFDITAADVDSSKDRCLIAACSTARSCEVLRKVGMDSIVEDMVMSACLARGMAVLGGVAIRRHVSMMLCMCGMTREVRCRLDLDQR